jgi:WD40 repeat protein
VNGVPKLADIGLVTSVDDTLSFVGTAGFIAPEGPGKPEADIYSLGMVLYEASTGQDRHEFPFIPAEWKDSPEYSGLLELNEVILQACKENPTQRYRSAWDMHADLVVVLNGKSVKQLKQLERRMAQLKRVAGIAALVLAIVGPSSYALYRTRRAAREEHARKVAADISFGNRALEAGNPLGALPYFAEALRLDQGNERAERNNRLRIGSILASSPKITHMWFEPTDVKDAEFSPDDRKVLVPQYFRDERIYDIETQESWTIPFGTKSGLRSSVFSADGRLILVTGEANQALVRDAASLTNIHSLPHADKVLMGRFSPDSTRIATACKDGFVRIWDALAGTNISHLQQQSDGMTFAGFSHNGKLILTGSRNRVAALWCADDGRLTNQFEHPDWVNWAAFSPDDKKIVTACGDHIARVWDLETNRRIYPDLVHNDAVESAEFSPDGRFILTASLDGTVRLWRTGDLQPATPCSILPHGEAVTHATFSSDGRQILTACMDGTVRIWDLAGATMPPKPEPRVYCREGGRFLIKTDTSLQVCASSDDKPISNPFAFPAPLETYQLTDNGRFVLASYVQVTPQETNHVTLVWDPQTARSVGPPSVFKEKFTGATMTRNGDYIAIYGTNQARIYETRTGNVSAGALVGKGTISAILFSPEGDLLVMISGKTVQVWNVRTGRPLYETMTVPVPVVYAEFSPGGRFLVTCSSDEYRTKCSAQVWDVRTGHPVGEPLKHSDGVLTASFSPTGDLIITTSEDFTAKIWDAKTSAQIGLPLRHVHQVEAAAWSPRGDWVATASIDKTARIWDPQTGDPLIPPLFHFTTLWNVRFLPDGAQLVCEDNYGNSYKWNLQVDSKSPEDISEIAELLSGGGFISPVSPAKGAMRPLKQTWEKLRANHPQDFVTSREDIIRWYEFQVQESELAKDYAAAIFHLKNLLKLCPDDKSLQEHLARTAADLKKQN